jgi:hypothetical protein
VDGNDAVAVTITEVLVKAGTDGKTRVVMEMEINDLRKDF